MPGIGRPLTKLVVVIACMPASAWAAAETAQTGSLLYPPGLNAKAVDSIRKGLKYLADSQARDGSWLPSCTEGMH